MNKENLIDAIKQIKERAEREIFQVQKMYILENMKYKEGDILEDHYHIIKVTGVKDFRLDHKGIPIILYAGIQLTKKLQPRKRQEYPYMYEAGVRRKLNEEGEK